METFPRIGGNNDMKKVFSILGLVAFSSAMAIGVGMKKEAKVAKADLETYIPFETAGNFTGFESGVNGYINNPDATFWGERYSFEGLDRFFRGEEFGDWKGSITSKTWTQETQYIYFTWGGAEKKDEVYIKIFYGAHEYVYKNDYTTGNTMMIHYFKIPDADFVASANMHIELYDNATGAGYGFHNFGYLHVNQTEDDVGAAMRYHLNHLADNTQINYDADGDARKTTAFNKRVQIYNYYRSNDHFKGIFLKSAGDNVDESFDDNAEFLNNWYRDPSFENWEAADPRHPDDIISTATYRADGGKNMPFNNENGFFRGWYENGKGYVANDYPIYRFVSRPFTLSGTGLISIKMGGKATIHVLNAATQDKLASVDASYFNYSSGDEGNACATGFNTCTMVRHVINLSQFLNQNIQLAIVDRESANWAAAYFDELVTKYTTSTFTKFKVDTFNQQYSDKNYRGFYFDKYVGVGAVSYEDNRDVSDTSIYLAAATFLETYQNTLRSKGDGVTYCSLGKSTLTTVINAYDAITNDDVKALIDASEDIDYTKEATGSTWYNIDVAKGTVGASMVNVKARAAALQESNSMTAVNVINSSQIIIILIIALLTCAAFATFVIIKKRRHN